MFTRRNFLALCGATTAGVLLPGYGLVKLPGRMVLQLTGPCSFCTKAPLEVFGLAGIAGREIRICDDCIGLCLDIIAEEVDRKRWREAPPPAKAALPADPALREKIEALMRMSPEELLAAIRRELDENAPAPPPRSRHSRNINLACSFCDLHQREVKKLIAGPRVYICDTCIGDGAALFIKSGKRFS